MASNDPITANYDDQLALQNARAALVGIEADATHNLFGAGSLWFKEDAPHKVLDSAITRANRMIADIKDKGTVLPSDIEALKHEIGDTEKYFKGVIANATPGHPAPARDLETRLENVERDLSKSRAVNSILPYHEPTKQNNSRLQNPGVPSTSPHASNAPKPDPDVSKDPQAAARLQALDSLVNKVDANGHPAFRGFINHNQFIQDKLAEARAAVGDPKKFQEKIGEMKDFLRHVDIDNRKTNKDGRSLRDPNAADTEQAYINAHEADKQKGTHEADKLHIRGNTETAKKMLDQLNTDPGLSANPTSAKADIKSLVDPAKFVTLQRNPGDHDHNNITKPAGGGVAQTPDVIVRT